MSLQETEAECAAVATAPRVSLADIEGAIAERHDFNLGHVLRVQGGPLCLMSVCCLVMKNGFVVVGKSAPASPENFNQNLGHELAYEDAVRQLWPLMGFALRAELAREAHIEQRAQARKALQRASSEQPGESAAGSPAA